MDTLIILVSFLLSSFFRAITTKYFLSYLSIPPLSLFKLFKKYILITLLIILPFVLLFISSIFIVDNDWMHLDSIETFFNDYYLENLFVLFFYLIEAFLITLMIKDTNENKIPFKITIILVSIFFIFDSALDIVTPEIDINEDINQTIDNNISNIKINK